jgi:hypothetical protein
MHSMAECVFLERLIIRSSPLNTFLLVGYSRRLEIFQYVEHFQADVFWSLGGNFRRQSNIERRGHRERHALPERTRGRNMLSCLRR